MTVLDFGVGSLMQKLFPQAAGDSLFFHSNFGRVKLVLLFLTFLVQSRRESLGLMLVETKKTKKLRKAMM